MFHHCACILWYLTNKGLWDASSRQQMIESLDEPAGPLVWLVHFIIYTIVTLSIETDMPEQTM